MEMMDKATILADVWLNTSGAAWQEFAQENDLGLPYAFGIANGHLLQLSEEGEQQIEEAWNTLCYMMNVDPKGDYIDFEHMALTGGIV